MTECQEARKNPLGVRIFLTALALVPISAGVYIGVARSRTAKPVAMTVPATPKYEGWKCLVLEDGMQRVCFDGASPSKSKNFVTEYRDKDGQPLVFLMWLQIERDEKGEVADVIRFYKRQGENWLLAETKTPTQNTVAKERPLKLKLFDEKSSLGNAFMAYRRRNGKDEDHIPIPSYTILK